MNIPHEIKTREPMGIVGRVRIITRKTGTKKMLRKTEWYRNLVVSSAGYGRNIICQRLGGINTYSLNVTHGEIGTGTTAVSNSDTALAAAVARGALTSAAVVNNAVTLQFFFSDGSLANGTYHEFGSFIDGTGSLGTGRMFNHVLFGTAYNKGSGEDTTIEVDITIN